MTLLVASITCESPETAEAAATEALRAGASAIEWRVDGYEGDAGALRCVIARFAHVPMIVTCRSTSEGGAFAGDTAQRVSRLIELARGTGAYIDFEFTDWQRSDNIRQKVLLAGADPSGGAPRLILSHHCFDGAPTDPCGLLARMSDDKHAQVVKLAFKARDLCDNLTAFDLMRGELATGGAGVAVGALVTAERAAAVVGAPVRVIICMGDEGQPSRILARRFGAWASYASADRGASTAPGQLTVAQSIEGFRWDSIDAATEWYGVIGDPVAHSRSPMLFNRLFEDHRLNAVYLPLRVTSETVLEHWLSGVRQRPWIGARGFSVTLPHKAAALRLADDALDERTRRIGAANTLVLCDGRWLACNTDAPAILESLSAALGVPAAGLCGMSADVLGSGGAARAVVASLVDVGASVTLFGRKSSSTRALAIEFGCAARPWEERASGSGEVLINATTVGMWPRGDESPMPEGGFAQRQLVFDLIYNPLRTRLLMDAERAGVATLSGLEMFARQAAMQFKLWTGQSADVSRMRDWVRASLTDTAPALAPDRAPSVALQSDRLGRAATPRAPSVASPPACIVLIGYRGSGKSRVARRVAEQLGRPVVDTDELIVQREGCTIRDIFEREGEAHFRRIEAEVIAGLSRGAPSVIAVGGGAVENEHSVVVLKRLGFVVWLTATAELLYARIQGDAHTHALRPSLTAMSGLDEVRAVLARRAAMYRSAADVEVTTDGLSVDEVTARVISAWSGASDGARPRDRDI